MAHVSQDVTPGGMVNSVFSTVARAVENQHVIGIMEPVHMDVKLDLLVLTAAKVRLFNTLFLF